jgi:hypothetical protein
MKEVIDGILAREVQRIDDLSKTEPLDIEEIKKLELLIRARRQFEEPEKTELSPLAQLTSEELLAFIKSESTAEPNSKKKSKKAK